MKRIKHFYTILSLFLILSLSCPAQPLTGIWENSERFIEYTGKADGTTEDTLRIVLKTYYRFVYEDMGTYPVKVKQEDTGNIYSLNIRYQGFRTPVTTSVWVHNTGLFSSFYKKTPHNIVTDTQQSRSSLVSAGANADTQPMRSPLTAILDGFWVEQGFRDGILIYQQEAPAFFDAFFFNGTQYIKFRYWTGDFEYKEKYARFAFDDGLQVTVPKFIRQYDTIYSCITDNGSKLKNYEKGSVLISDGGNGIQQLTLTPQGGGAGTHAVGDVYPHQKYPKIQGLPLYYDETDGAFAFGEPFLTRSSISDLQEEIKRHNSLKRPPPEPLLKADELDFYWERIKQIRKQD
ncbi:hypothetical protein C5N99_10770 [Treponema medium]|uniref:YARHG domain-containing protein n=2 Tax=Treponema medium TaxID=58231 RepID=A0AA87NNI8_TREMD|nr:hypothetical protein [Treponema medium]EPF27845.1 hypothetical protein HMPREF9195_01975 [Treponema medium ATCC 700293]QSH93061.1 hypothetical protein C5N99_10770 [Treponema medium]QSH98076.1 hypothetical protein DWB79_10010 [Treponema medium]